MTTFKILRFFRDNDELNQSVVATGLSQEEAQAHCNDPESSSTTATGVGAVRRTLMYGPWFDGWTEEA